MPYVTVVHSEKEKYYFSIRFPRSNTANSDYLSDSSSMENFSTTDDLSYLRLKIDSDLVFYMCPQLSIHSGFRKIVLHKESEKKQITIKIVRKDASTQIYFEDLENDVYLSDTEFLDCIYVISDFIKNNMDFCCENKKEKKENILFTLERYKEHFENSLYSENLSKNDISNSNKKEDPYSVKKILILTLGAILIFSLTAVAIWATCGIFSLFAGVSLTAYIAACASSLAMLTAISTLTAYVGFKLPSRIPSPEFVRLTVDPSLDLDQQNTAYIGWKLIEHIPSPEFVQFTTDPPSEDTEHFDFFRRLLTEFNFIGFLKDKKSMEGFSNEPIVESSSTYSSETDYSDESSPQVSTIPVIS